jgi:hypothetical protein
MALSYGLAARLTALFGGSRPGQKSHKAGGPPTAGREVDPAGVIDLEVKRPSSSLLDLD